MSKKDDRIAGLEKELGWFQVVATSRYLDFLEVSKENASLRKNLEETEAARVFLHEENTSLREQLDRQVREQGYFNETALWTAPAQAPASEPERGPVRRRFVPLAERAASEPLVWDGVPPCPKCGGVMNYSYWFDNQWCLDCNHREPPIPTSGQCQRSHRLPVCDTPNCECQYPWCIGCGVELDASEPAHRLDHDLDGRICPHGVARYVCNEPLCASAAEQEEDQ